MLKGTNGYDVGSPEYFRNINQSSIVGDIMWEFSNGSHCVDYKDALDKLCKSVVEVIYEVHSDLKRYAEVLSFFPKEEREETLKFLEKINEVLKFGYSNASTIDACKAYLTLSAYDTRRKSYESMSRVEEAAKKVENGYKVSFSTGMEYIRKALDYGISFTIGDDSEKKAFFDDVLDGKDKDFLQDVYNFLKFKKEKSSLQGKCYKTILSREYIEKLSCEAISSRLYDELKNERSYYDIIKSGFERLAEIIQKDINVDSIEMRDNYLKDLFEATGCIDNLLNKNLSRNLRERTEKRDTDPVESDDNKVRDYIYTSQYIYFVENVRPKTSSDDKDRYFIEIDGERYPTMGKETPTVHHWSYLDKDFFNTTFKDLLASVENNKINIKYIFSESVNGDIDFKQVNYAVSQDSLYLIEGFVHNRNEMGNYVWAYLLQANGYSGYFSGALAQGGTLKNSFEYIFKDIKELDKITLNEIIDIFQKHFRFDEPWDKRARWNGVKQFYEDNDSIFEYYWDYCIKPVIIICLIAKTLV